MGKILIIIFCFSICLISFLVQGDLGFNPLDEGRLFTEIREMFFGKIPILDFNSYDPLRYYLSKSFFIITDDFGILNLRLFLTLLQGVGLSIGSILLYNEIKGKKDYLSYFLFFLSILILFFFTYPRHKAFDIATSIICVAIFTLFLKYKNYFLHGFFIGIIAILGRNHGVYAAVSSLLLFLYVFFKSDEQLLEKIKSIIKNLIKFGFGIFIGYLPIILLCIFKKGFFNKFLEGIIFNIKNEYGVNFPLPIVMPWDVSFQNGINLTTLRSFFISILFLGLIIYAIWGVFIILKSLKNKEEISPLVLSSILLNFTYQNYAFQRADFGHLCHAIFPMLLGVLAIILTIKNRIIKSFILVICFVCCFIIFVPQNEILNSKNYKTVFFEKDKLKVEEKLALKIKNAKKLTKKYAPKKNDHVYIAPFLNIFPILNKNVRSFETLTLYRKNRKFLQEEIRRLKKQNLKLVIILNDALDGNPKLRYKKTHYLMYHFFNKNFKRKKKRDLFLVFYKE